MLLPAMATVKAAEAARPSTRTFTGMEILSDEVVNSGGLENITSGGIDPQENAVRLLDGIQLLGEISCGDAFAPETLADLVVEIDFHGLVGFRRDRETSR